MDGDSPGFDAAVMQKVGAHASIFRDQAHELRAQLEQLPHIVQGVNTIDPSVHLEATTQFRQLLTIERNPPIQMVIDAGVVPRFVEFLQRDDTPWLQIEAARALTNSASGTSENTRVVMIDSGAVPIFCRLLLSPNDDVREQAVEALGNIAGDSPTCRDLVLREGAKDDRICTALRGIRRLRTPGPCEEHLAASNPPARHAIL